MKRFFILTLGWLVLVSGCRRATSPAKRPTACKTKRPGKAYGLFGPLSGEDWQCYKNGRWQRAAFWKDGKLSGKELLWHKNGRQKAEYPYRNGKRHGTAMIWHEDGTKYIRREYRAGLVEGTEIRWYKGGKQKVRQRQFERGMKSGAFTTWHKNGTKLEEGYYLRRKKCLKSSLSEGIYGPLCQSKQHGLYRSWHANGAMRSHGRYMYGIACGVWKCKNQKAEATTCENILGLASCKKAKEKTTCSPCVPEPFEGYPHWYVKPKAPLQR